MRTKRWVSLLLCLLFCVTLFPMAALADGDRYLEINGANFPDATFLQWVKDNLANGKDYMTKAEVDAVTTIDVNNKGISSLVGIEHFRALKKLNCDYNRLTTLDVSHNVALTQLGCWGNQLTSLDVSQNTALEVLTCYDNYLTALDVRNNAALTTLYCGLNSNFSFGTNKITKLDTSKNKALKSLWCAQIQLTELDVSQNTALEYLLCEQNQLTALDVSHNTALKKLDCSRNQLTTLDVSHNTALEELNCSRNRLMTLNMGQNMALRSLHCTDNQLADLDVSHNTALETLDCSWNKLTTLDVSKNTALKRLSCYFNKLDALDVSHNTALENLDCSGNYLTELDVSHNTALIVLDCGTFEHGSWTGLFFLNKLTTLDVSQNTALRSLHCAYNQLADLDVSHNTALEKLDCSWNHQLTTLNVSHNTKLISLDCSRCNTLTALDVSHNTKLKSLDCSSDKLTALDVSRNTALETLDCRWNQLTTLDMSHNTALEDLDCGVNQLTTLDVSHNTALETLDCTNNRLPTLDLSANVKLTKISMDQKIPDQTLASTNGAYQYDLSKLVPLGKMAKATVSGDGQLDKATGKVTFAKKVDKFIYQYATGHGAMGVTVLFEKGDDPITPPTIKTQPKSAKVKSGSKAKFTVKAKEKDVTYQWFSRASAKDEWKEMKGETKDKLNVVGIGANNGWQYRCRVRTAAGGEAFSNPATLTVKIQPPAIKTQPKSLAVVSGKKAKFAVKASGPKLTYTWFSRPNAESEWTPVAGQTKSSLSVVASKANDGSQYYCHIQNADGEVDSAVVTLTVTPEAPTIKTQPKDAKVKIGGKAKFKVKASGKNVTYQWYYRTSETSEWVLMKGATAANLTVIATAENIGWQYRCLAKNADGQAYSNPATLRQK